MECLLDHSRAGTAVLLRVLLREATVDNRAMARDLRLLNMVANKGDMVRLRHLNSMVAISRVLLMVKAILLSRAVDTEAVLLLLSKAADMEVVLLLNKVVDMEAAILRHRRARLGISGITSKSLPSEYGRGLAKRSH